jgi:hypothetical protein
MPGGLSISERAPALEAGEECVTADNNSRVSVDKVTFTIASILE